MRWLERAMLLQIIDNRWREHLHDMDYLQNGIHLRAHAQLDPLVAYKNEAYTLFGDLMNLIWGDFAQMLFHVEVQVAGAEAPPPEPVRRSTSAISSSATGGGRVSYSSGATAPVGAQAIEQAAAAEHNGAAGQPMGDEQPAPVAVEQRHVDDEPGRNDPCWCGSGKKYKKCHGA
jgi:preprotein translocase subunit SecA